VGPIGPPPMDKRVKRIRKKVIVTDGFRFLIGLHDHLYFFQGETPLLYMLLLPQCRFYLYQTGKTKPNQTARCTCISGTRNGKKSIDLKTFNINECHSINLRIVYFMNVFFKL
jgi:hypothetical protein